MTTQDTQRRTHFPLLGRLLIQTDIELLTGLHIGGTPAGIEIGGMNNPIIRNPLTDQPYIPGSSLRGKLRSLLEKYENLPFNQPIQDIFIHGYTKESGMSAVCYIFGVNSDVKEARPTRLFVRDVTRISRANEATSDYDSTRMVEVKWEASIDRVTSAAVPRQQERLSAGLFFREAELVFNFYTYADYNRFEKVLLAMRLLEDDYLGGSGSRGSGKIAFRKLIFTAKKVDTDQPDSYSNPAKIGEYDNLDAVFKDRAGMLSLLQEKIPISTDKVD